MIFALWILIGKYVEIFKCAEPSKVFGIRLVRSTDQIKLYEQDILFNKASDISLFYIFDLTS